jgi:release factor glutamine methyltransferase
VSGEPLSLAESLRRAQQQGLARIDAQLLHLLALGRPLQERAWLLAHDDHMLDADAQGHIAALVARRLAQEPMAYITGHKAFHGLMLQIDARVLDPRPDTETLVDWALSLIPNDRPQRVLDLGTGSGAIALAIAQNRPQAQVVAMDASADALAVAQGNAQRLNLPVELLHSHWFEALGGLANRPFDVIVSNPPYIAQGDVHLNALQHEPQEALVSGPDGLDDIRHIVAHAPLHLRAGGWLLLEHGHDQADAVQALFTQQGWRHVKSQRDMAGIARCTGAQPPDSGDNSVL